MGIDTFNKMIKETYPESFQTKWLQSYDHVYIDINYALYYCSYNAINESEVYDRLYNFFDSIFYETNPTTTINVCTDGVAPFAKLILQRKRRSNNLRDKNKFDSLLFTPGTVFMNNLKDNLSTYFKYIENLFCITVNYLDHIIDEAELKLKYQLMCNVNNFPNTKHIVVTNDADMVIMLTTLQKQELHNIFILYKNKYDYITLSIGKMLDLHTDKVGSTLNYNLDFTLVNLLMGNDYLPKVTNVTFPKIWNAYSTLYLLYPNGLVDCNLKINCEFFIKLLLKIMIFSKNQFLKHVTFENSFSKLHENYFDGLTWCLFTYYNGKCVRYDYMYEFNNMSPHLLNLAMSLHSNNKLLNINNKLTKPTNSLLYAMLILPNVAKDLIDKKYHKFMDENDELYSVENCEKCIELKNKINISKNNEFKKELTLHKKNHNVINLMELKNIEKKFEIYLKKY